MNEGVRVGRGPTLRRLPPALVVLLLLVGPRSAVGADPCSLPAMVASIEEIRSRAEERCAQRGMTCESGVLDYVRCVNAAVAAAVSRGRLPRECGRAAEVSPGWCGGKGTP